MELLYITQLPQQTFIVPPKCDPLLTTLESLSVAVTESISCPGCVSSLIRAEQGSWVGKTGLFRFCRTLIVNTAVAVLGGEPPSATWARS